MRNDVVIQALETVDLSPGCLPSAEVGGELVRSRGKRLQELLGGDMRRHPLFAGQPGLARCGAILPQQFGSPVDRQRSRDGIGCPAVIPRAQQGYLGRQL
jgi:hypothetical protein